jgi:HAE1 family hydrophobic/amphiphilic exporter-1
MFIRLIPRSQRKLSADEVAQELRPKLAQVEGISAYLQNLPPIPIGGRLTKSQYQYTLTSPNTQKLYRYATLLLEQLRKARELQDVTSDMQIHNPQVNITINRNMAQTYGVTARQIEDALYDAYGARQISTIYTASNQYQVIIELEPGYQLDPQVLSLLYIRSSNSTAAVPQLVPLSEPRLAGFDPPWTLPMLRRNEVWVEVARPEAA